MTMTRTKYKHFRAFRDTHCGKCSVQPSCNSLPRFKKGFCVGYAPKGTVKIIEEMTVIEHIAIAPMKDRGTSLWGLKPQGTACRVYNEETI